MARFAIGRSDDDGQWSCAMSGRLQSPRPRGQVHVFGLRAREELNTHWPKNGPVPDFAIVLLRDVRLLVARRFSIDNGEIQWTVTKEPVVNHRRRQQMVLGLIVMIGWFLASAIALPAAPDSPAKRAKPPKWSADVLDVFFPDAREQLVGQRPAYGVTTSPVVGAVETSRMPTATEPRTSDVAWSTLIDAETIEAEIKRLGAAITADVTTPGEFKGGGYKAARRHFSLLAVLFGIGAEYDGSVRWQDAAAGLRDQFARAGQNAKVGTDQTYREATLRKQELEELVRGTRPQTPSGERIAEWSAVAGRAPLMQRLNIAQQERLTKWLANDEEFARHRDEVRHESQLVAALANVIARKNYEYWDDETFAAYASELRDASTELSAAAEAEDYSQARQALDRATKACADCHEGYRG